MSDVSGQLTLDTSQAQNNVAQFIQSLTNLSSSSMVTFAGLQELGNGLEGIAQKTLGAVTGSIQTASSIQSGQAQLTASTYNFGQSLQANTQSAAGLTKQILTMSTSIAQPIPQMQHLANSIALTGARGQSIIDLTKNFAEFGQVTGTNADQLTPKINQLAQQFNIAPSNTKGMENLTGSVYKLSTMTSGGTQQILSMTDRLAGLSSTNNITEKSFLALSAAAGNVDSRIRGGGVGAVSALIEQFNQAQQNPGLVGSQNLFALLGTNADQFAQTMQSPDGTIAVLDQFLSQYDKLDQVSKTNVLANMGITPGSAQGQGVGEMANEYGYGKGIPYYQQQVQGDQSGDVSQAYGSYLGTSAAKVQQAKDQFDQLKNSIGQDLLPVVNMAASAMETFASVLNSVPAPILAIGAGLATLVAGAVAAVGVVSKLAATFGALQSGWNKIRGNTKSTSDQSSSSGTQGQTQAIQANTEALQANTEAIQQNNEAAAQMGTSSMDNVPSLEEENAMLEEQNALLEQNTSLKTESGVAGVESAAVAPVAAASMGANETAATTETAVASESAAATVETGAAGVTSGIGATIAGAATALTPFVFGIAAATAALSTWSASISDSAQKAVSTQQKQFDTTNVGGIQSAIAYDQQQYAHYGRDMGIGQKGIGGFLSRGFEDIASLSGVSSANKDADMRAQYTQQIAQLNTELNTAKQVASDVFGGNYSNDQLNVILQKATQNAINLATGGQQAKDQLEQLFQQPGVLGSGLQGAVQGGGSQGSQGAPNVQNQQLLDTMGAAQQQLPMSEFQANTQDALQAQDATIKLGEAQRNLANYGAQVAEAENQVAEAETNVQASTLNVAQAEIQLGQARIALANFGATLAENENQINEAYTQEAIAALNVTQAQLTLEQASMQLQNLDSQLADAANKVSEAFTQQAQAQIQATQAQITVNEAALVQQVQLEQAQVQSAQATNQVTQAQNQYNDALWTLTKLNGPDWAIQQAQANNQVKDSALSLTQATLDQQNAQWQLTQLQEEHASNRDIEVAQLNLQEATQKVTDTTTQLQAAQQQVNELPTDHALQVADSTTQLNSAQIGLTASTVNLQNALVQLNTQEQMVANNVGVISSQLNLQSALQRVQDSSYQIVTAQEQLNMLQSGTVQLQYQQAVQGVFQAQQRVNDSQYQVVQAQAQLNTLMLGGTQLQYQQALLGVTQAQQRVNDSQYQVIAAQQTLNNLQDGNVQLQYQQAAANVTQAQLQEAIATNNLWVQQQEANNHTVSQQEASQHLADILMQSANPQLVAMGQSMMGISGAGQQAAASVSGLQQAIDASNQSVANWVNNLQQAQSQLEAVGVNAQAAAQAAQQLNNQVGYGMTYGQSAANQNAQFNSYDVGGLITQDQLAFIHANELVLPLGNPSRMQELLTQAGILSSGQTSIANMGGGGFTSGGAAAPTSSSSSGGKIINNYLNAYNQAVDPTELADAFAWQMRFTA